MLKISKSWAMPSAWTFTIKPIRELVARYVCDGIGWIDPFAGENSPAEFTNDQHPDRKARWHMDAEQFCIMMRTMALSNGCLFNGVLVDPPYSYRQISEHYAEMFDKKLHPNKARSIDTTANFYNRVMNPLCDVIKSGGYAISFGWNTNGFGAKRGFEQVEILIVAHGGRHNDTLVTVERKL